MKTKLLIATLLLLFAAPQGITAQDGIPKRGDTDFRDVKVFEYPKQVLDYNGQKVEAFANVIYNYDDRLGKYRYLTLRMCFLPLDTEGFPADLQDSIAKYARHGTVVCHSGIMCKKPRQAIKGKADMFSKAFSVKFDNWDAQAEVKYSAVFDPKNPAKCKIDYKISRARWSKPDETIGLYPSSAEDFDVWRPAIHDVGKWGYRYNNPEHICYLIASVKCRAPRRKNKFTGKIRVEKCDSVYLKVYPSLQDFNVGKGRRSISIFSGDVPDKYAFSKNGSEGVCAQGSFTVREGNCFPFMDRDKAVWLDYRAKAKCCYLNSNLVMEQVSFSCLFHY